MAIEGLIAISCPEFTRHSVFYGSLLNIDAPPNVVVWQTRSSNIADNRNTNTQKALELGAEWVFFVDDDQIFLTDTLTRLLADNLDIVSGLYMKREIPFLPVAFDREDERGYVKPKLLKPEDKGIIEVKATGAGCLLVKTKVFRAMGYPYWTLGQLDKVGWSDDIDFCRRARAAGFTINVDLGVKVGHLATCVIWPVQQEDGTWTTSAQFSVHPDYRDKMTAGKSVQDLVIGSTL